MSDRRRYVPSPIPNQVDVAWLKQEFQRLSQSLALVEDALLSLDGQLGGYGADIDAIEGWPAAGATAEDFSGWDDLRFPAQAINPAGAADAPSVDNVLTSFPGTLLFSGHIENVICGVAQMPHAWKRGSTIRPHIHWSKTTGSSSAVSWVFYYRHCGMAGEAPGSWVGPTSGIILAGDQTVTNEHLITSFGDVSMTGKKESSCINWQIRRLGNADADNNAVRLLEFDIHFELDKRGTSSEIPT